MPLIHGLRSEYSLTGRLVHFGRMLDKIRLHDTGRLPPDYHAALGAGFDARTCEFLRIDYAALVECTLSGGCDEDILAWAHDLGGTRTDDECRRWNRFMMTLGWRDDRTPILRERIVSFGLVGKPIETFFDLNDYDEGRDPVGDRAWELNEPRIFLLMGVAGSGKTTVGRHLAASLGWRFTDADDFHPPANIAKITAGTPLTDEDRAPWLASLRAHVDASLAARDDTVLACSVLKSAYRDVLVSDPGRVKLIHLKGDPELIRSRLYARVDHWAGPALLESQLETLEEPRNAFTLDIAATPDAIAAAIRQHYAL